jgi:hypothetical protein
MQWANEMASTGIDAKCYPRGFGKGGFGARPTEAEESALGAARVAVYEDALHLKHRRVWRDIALAFASADPSVCPRVKNSDRLTHL